MSDKGLSSLTAASSHSTTDLLYAVIGGHSRKITIENFSASQTFPDGSLSAPGIRFTNDTNTGIYRVAADTIGIVEGGVNIARSVPITNISDPSTGVGSGASGRMFAMLDENWFQNANFHWILSTNDQIYPANIQVTGVWAVGDIARITITPTGVGALTYSHTVVTGGTSTAAVAAALRALMAADAVLTAADIFPQAVSGSSWDIPIHYSQSPMTFSSTGTVSAAGTFTYTDTTNLLDGPIGLYIGRRTTGRTPQDGDFIGGVDYWGQVDSPGNLRLMVREHIFIDDVDAIGRYQLQILDTSVSESPISRLVVRKGLYVCDANGASPSGGTSGDMGAGSINTPVDLGYFCDGKGYLRWGNSADALQMIAVGSKRIQIGNNAAAVINLAADGSALHPEVDNVPTLGSATRRFGTGFLSGLVIAAVASAALAFNGLTTSDQVLGSSEATSSQTLALFSATGSQFPGFQFYRSKNATVGSATVVADGDVLGAISWLGAQQTGTFATQSPAARIRAEVDGTVTSGAGGDMPGRIIWSTTADGSGTLTDRLILDSSGVLKPASDGGATLGTTTLGYAHVHINTGGTINWEGGDVVITHAGNTLTFSGASSGYNFDALTTISLAGAGLRVVNTTDNATVQVARFEGDRATMADNDEAYIALMLSDDGGTQTEFARVTWVATDVNTGTSVDGRIDLAVVTAGALADELSLTGAALFPSSAGGLALGITSTNEFSGLCLNEAAAINWDNGEAVLTKVSGASQIALSGSSNASLVLNHTAGLSMLGSTARPFQMYGAEAGSASAVIGVFGTGATDQGAILFYRSRNATKGDATVVQNGDSLGGIFWTAAQQTGTFATQTVAAAIAVEVDGTVTSGAGSDMPSRMILSTGADGGSSTERVRITSGGAVRITGNLGLGSPVTKTADFTLADTENHIINNRAATNTATLPAASAWPGRMLFMKTIQAQTVVSASSNVVPSTSATAGTAILPATDGAWALLVSDATNWIIMAASPLV